MYTYKFIPQQSAQCTEGCWTSIGWNEGFSFWLSCAGWLDWGMQAHAIMGECAPDRNTIDWLFTHKKCVKFVFY